jgi:excisionase family DNA binding protein
MAALVASVAETAGLLAVSERHVYDLLDEGALPEVRLGCRRLVPLWAITAVVDAGRATFDPAAAERRLAEAQPLRSAPCCPHCGEPLPAADTAGTPVNVCPACSEPIRRAS